MTASPDLTLYGAVWCPYCQRTKKFLQEQRVPFAWIDLDVHPEASATIAELNGGTRSIPTLVLADGSHLIAPDTETLAAKLGINRQAMRQVYDLIIVGGGPAGLTTAIYGARENLQVLVLDKGGLGGQAGVTERVDNYPGFPEGIGGADLAYRFIEQARRYGVELVVTTSTGDEHRAGSVLIATGSTYRRTGAPGESELIGAGIHFCATCDGPIYRGEHELIVIGGGNSGLEEGLFLTQFVEKVTVVEFSDRLAGSKLLQEKVLTHPKMEVLTGTAVTEFVGGPTGKLTGVVLVNRASGARTERAAAGAFVFIGLDPNTGFLGDTVELDARGFIVADRTMETSVPGVFVAGDVRADSTKQLASAVGEGAAAAIQIRHHLDARAREAEAVTARAGSRRPPSSIAGGPERRDRHGVHARAERARTIAAVQHDSGDQLIAEPVTQEAERREGAVVYVDRGLDLDRHDPPVGGLEQQVDLGPVPITPVVERRRGLGPRQLAGDLAGHEALEQLPRVGRGGSRQGGRIDAKQRGGETAVDHVQLRTAHGLARQVA